MGRLRYPLENLATQDLVHFLRVSNPKDLRAQNSTKCTISVALSLSQFEQPTKESIDQALKQLKAHTMSQFSTASHYQHQPMEASAEMLASAMMLVSLSESAVVNPGFKSSFSRAPSSCNSSASSLSGWGSAMTRKSYKVDLCSLGSSSSSSQLSESTSQQMDHENASWGFYADTQ